MIIYATFVTGLQEPVACWVTEEKHHVRQILDGAVLYDARQKKEPLPCFFNTFTVLETAKNQTVEQLMKKILGKPIKYQRKRGSFRIVTSKENQLISVDNKLRGSVEKMISAQTGLIPDRRGGGREFWFLERSEGLTLFMERHIQPVSRTNRLNSNRLNSGPSIIKKGELRPELAYSLNRLAEPTQDDVMLDPFCGHGAIPRARAHFFPCKEIHGLDIKINKKNLPHAINIRKADIKNIYSIFSPQSVDVIVTDPPWGHFNEKTDIPSLYEELFKACEYLLKPNGRAVILTAQKDLFISKWSKKIQARYDILVSGQKAAIFVIKASAN